MSGGLIASLFSISLVLWASWGIGSVFRTRLFRSSFATWEWFALQLTLGLGFTSLILSLATLSGLFHWLTAILTGVGCLGLASLRRPAPGWHAPSFRGGALAFVAILAALGGLVPVTSYDALNYLIPSARHIAETATIRVWSDQSFSMFPQSQAILLAFMIDRGADRLGLLSAIEWLLAFGTMSVLFRTVCSSSASRIFAMMIAIGSPVVAVLVAGAKEDLFVLAAVCGAAVFLMVSQPDYALIGAFAGTAAAFKYPGAVVVAGLILWPLVNSRGSNWRAAGKIALCAAVAGSLWYVVNLIRYGNPVAFLVFGARGTPLTMPIVNAWARQWGLGRSLLSFVTTPVMMFFRTSVFGGRAELFNPLAWIGIGAVFRNSCRMPRAETPAFVHCDSSRSLAHRLVCLCRTGPNAAS